MIRIRQCGVRDQNIWRRQRSQDTICMQTHTYGGVPDTATSNLFTSNLMAAKYVECERDFCSHAPDQLGLLISGVS